MIQIGDEAPRWLKELERFITLKSLLFIHGNILDLVTFPVTNPESKEVFWADDDLPNFLQRYLLDKGYRVVGFVDPVDGLYFPTQKMERDYRALEAGKIPDPEKETPEENASAPSTPARPGASATDWGKIFRGIRTAVRNFEYPCAFVFNLASRFIASPGSMAKDERHMLTHLLKASLESADVYTSQETHLKNSLILICDKINDLPPYLYVDNPRARAILLDRPDSNARSRFLHRTYQAFPDAESNRLTDDLASRFTALTDGLANYELNSLVHLARQEGISLKNIDNLCHRYKYGVTESEWDKLDRRRLAGAETKIRSRIKGQDEAVARVLDIIKRARIGLAAGGAGAGNRPRGVLFFAGPTGVGKTEMAKTLAELLFGEEDRCIRFDMSEYSAPQSDEKLLGAPPGYVGYEEGGQLTNAMKEQPFSVLLFDEIEKAHGGIFDKFLQILDDGRLTDGRGETVYFGESIIIFTSNLGTVSRSNEPGEKMALVSPQMPFETMKETILSAIRDHFNFNLGRPEILNRFGDNFVVFDFIKPPVDEQIVDLLISRLITHTLAKWKFDLVIEPQVKEQLTTLSRANLHHGGRGIRNVVDTALVNPLTRFLFDRLDTLSEGLSGREVRVMELTDHGLKTPYRFELKADIQ